MNAAEASAKATAQFKRSEHLIDLDCGWAGMVFTEPFCRRPYAPSEAEAHVSNLRPFARLTSRRVAI
jgi:hypothetical protein